MVYIDYANSAKTTDEQYGNLGTVWINGEKFVGIGYNGLLTVNTKTYVSEPTRANDGSMPNIGDHETFVVPRCKINFKYMNIDDYRRLCDAIMPNEFPVTYYDKQFGWVTHYMYCEPEEMTKIYNIGTAVIGVLDYEISFIGTLNSIKTLYVRYDGNGGTIKNLNTDVDSNGTFSTSVEYTLGDRVLYDGDYWEAIYYVDSFKGYTTAETDYWESIIPREWNNITNYIVGNLVYTSTTANNKETRHYYECIKDNTGGQLTDKTYWKSVSVMPYSDNTTYTKGDYAYTQSGNTISYFKAKYELKNFKEVYPTNSSYWKKLPIYSSIEIKWGQSLFLADQDDLFVPPSGETSQDKWEVWVIKDDENGDQTSNYYRPNQNITVFRSMVLKAVWE